MNTEQRKRMANREFVTGEEGQETSYSVQVSGELVELHRQREEPWDNEHGTGPDITHDCWEMSLSDLKKLVEAAKWCIEKSEAFEAKQAQ